MQNKQVAYITHTVLDKLQSDVNTAISKGWEPLGGLTMTYYPDLKSIVFGQAMIINNPIKEEKESK